MRSNGAHEFDEFLEYLRRSRGFDFSGYKRPSLTRRVQKRMQAVGVGSYAEFMQLLEKDPAEFDHLFNTVLINVTAFFRDEVPWEALTSDIVPRLLEAKQPDAPIRVWSAGCASGEEAYTLAIVLAEVLGHEAFRARVKIYATDVDEHALTVARHATYEAKRTEGLTPELLDKYFERRDSNYVFRKDLRRYVIFGRNDLVQDSPISRVDLLTCRNTLMYFDAATQAKILARFHFALSDDGYLLLGRAETLLAHSESFTPVDLKRRIFRKIARVNYRARLLAMTGVQNQAPVRASWEDRLRDASWDVSPLAQIVVDGAGNLAVANDRARSLFNIAITDIGRPFHDLELSYRPTDLRSVIDQTTLTRKPLAIRNVEWMHRGGEVRWLDVQAAPLLPGGQSSGAVVISFDDVTAFNLLNRELEKSNSELEGAYEELQSTNEELETTNEELQSTVEELETTNEELQSTNEELETMNEELQSTNEELTTINDELRRLSEELNDVNDFMGAVLTSLRGGVTVLDTELRVEVWSERAFDLWGVREDEVRGTHFMMLDIGLPVQALAKPIRLCLAGESDSESVALDAINRRGKPILCDVTCTPLRRANGVDIRGVIVVMEESAPRTAPVGV